MSVPRYLEEEQKAPALAEYWRIISERRATVISIFLVVFVTVTIGTLKAKRIYEGKVLLEIKAETPNAPGAPAVETAGRLLLSRSLSERVVDDLELYRNPSFYTRPGFLQVLAKSPNEAKRASSTTANHPDESYRNAVERFSECLTVTVIPNSSLIAIQFYSEDPELAARAANTLALDYVDESLRMIVEDYQSMLKRQQYLGKAIESDEKNGGHAAARQLSDTQQRDLLEELSRRAVQSSTVRLVDAAQVPRDPVRPRVLLNLLLGLIVGLGLALGLAFLQEYLDDTLKSPDDVQRFLRLPALGIIPTVHSAKYGVGYSYGYGRGYGRAYGRASAPLIPREVAAVLSPGLLGATGSWALLEAYRSLRTSILLSTSARLRTIVLTSALPGEGKTTTAVNLAITLAQLGSRVLLIDADMRKPRVAQVLKVQVSPEGRGLSTCLTGQFGLDESVFATVIPNVFVVPTGPLPPNPPELLSGKAMQRLLRDAQERFDFVLLDSPPLLTVSDGRILAAQADGVVLVARGAESSRTAVNRAKMNLLQVSANVIGVVLNNMDFSHTKRPYYYSGYYSYDPLDMRH